MILLDTNICIYVMRERELTLMQKFESLAAELSVSIVTVAELEYGVERSLQRIKNAKALEAFLVNVKIEPWDRACAKQYAKIRNATRAQPVGAEDLMIAACAMARSAVLVTNNTREFQRISGLKLENWVTN